jgi:hypothetical protein
MATTRRPRPAPPPRTPQKKPQAQARVGWPSAAEAIQPAPGRRQKSP